MAQVFTNDMVAHVWAQQTQESGRSNNGQFYFEGRALWSYGTHFCVGFIVPAPAAIGARGGNVSGRPVALLESASRSITTTRHQSYARSAVSHLEYFRVPDLAEIARYTLPALLADQSAPDIREGHKAALLRHVERHAVELDDGAGLFLCALAGKSPAAWAKLKAKATRAADKAKADKAKAKAARLAEDAESLAARIKSDSGFAAWLKEEEERAPWGRFPADNWRGSEYRKASPAESLAVAATGLHRITAAAKSLKGHKRAADVLAARLKATRARVRYLKTWEAKGAAVASFRRYKEGLRGLAARHRNDGLDASAATALRDCVRYVANARPGLLSASAKAGLSALFDLAEKAHAAAKAREAAARFAREEEARESWLNGGPLRSSFRDIRGGAMIRASGVERDDAGQIVAGTLDTSQGASVPLVHALKAFAFVRRVVERGEDWRANGHCIRVGHFRVDHISAQGDMTAGCHRINREEMERLAAALGVSDIPADDSALESSRGAA